MKKHILFFTLIVTLSNCQRLETEDILPTLDIISTSLPQPTKLYLRAEVLESEIEIDTRGFCWSENPMPTIDDAKIVSTPNNYSASFNDYITDLKPDTEYHIRAYANTVQGVAYSEEITRRTLSVSTPPCEINENTIILEFNQTVNYTVNFEADIQRDHYLIKGNASNSSVEIFFTSPIETNDYRTASDGWVQVSQAQCSIKGRFNFETPFGTPSTWYYAGQGQDIYVEKLEGDRYNVQFCDLEMTSNNGTDITCDGHFITE